MCYHMFTNNCSNECEDEDEEEDGQVVYEHLCLPYGFKIMFSKRASTYVRMFGGSVEYILRYC